MKMQTEESGQFTVLKSAKAIGQFFGVSAETVTFWREKGAPIYFISSTYKANPQELWNWLTMNEKNV